jgi:hypothetical protein
MTLRRAHALVVLAALAAGGTIVDATPAAAVCSVFSRHPCHPTFCSVFQRRPCIPEIEYPLGQDLLLTIETKDEPAGADAAARHERTDGEKVDMIATLFDAFRACWVPPPRELARHGMQMSVRFSLRRNGEIIGAPRVTYTSRDASREVREIYHNAIAAALERCTPLPLSPGLGGAVAGRPIAIRYVDNRTLQAGAP